LFVATETARDLGQLARQMARVDDCRSASEFHLAGSPEPGAPQSLAGRRARVEEATARRRQAQAGSAEGGRRPRGEDDELREAREAVAEARRREQHERVRARGMDRSR
jgi:hypothetical protein